MAYGLGLIYGVLRVVNLNHGGIIMAGAYVGWVLHEKLGIDPYLSIPVVMAVSFVLGIALHPGGVRGPPRGAARGGGAPFLRVGGWRRPRDPGLPRFSPHHHTLP